MNLILKQKLNLKEEAAAANEISCARLMEIIIDWKPSLYKYSEQIEKKITKVVFNIPKRANNLWFCKPLAIC